MEMEQEMSIDKKKAEKIVEEDDDEAVEVNKKKYFLMAGSYDSTISFWEFDLENLPVNTSLCTEVSCNAAYEKPSQNETSNKFFFIYDIQTFNY